MTEIDKDAGRVLMVGLPGAKLDAATARHLSLLRPGGVILFARNLVSPAGTIALLDAARDVLPSPPLFAIDQEGGRVSRLERWVGPTPTAVALAAAGVGVCEQFARATARVVRAIGFNLDFAPVVDVCTAEATNGIADRSFGADPECVTQLAGSFLDGLQDEGLAGCLKHFPGLGETSVDSHVELPTAHRSRQKLDEVELLPFCRLASRAASVMISHGHYPALDPTPALPATLSAAIVGGLLRDRIGFDGLVVSDDLEMGAIDTLDGDGEAAVRSIEAGCDLVLYCSSLDRAERAWRRLAARAAADPTFACRLQRAARRVETTAARWPAPPGDVAAFDAARSALERISRAAVSADRCP
jgi:beta-N-acetylhexosaminidase